MEEIKNVTISLSQDMVDWLVKNRQSIDDGQSIDDLIIASVLELRNTREVSTYELKGLFTPEEWCFLADSINGIWITDIMRNNVQMLIDNCEESAMNGLDKKWGVDMENFKKKLTSLHGANVAAIYARIEKLWNNDLADDVFKKF